MKILGIETSFDDTGVAVVEAHEDGMFEILSNVIRGQDHRATGGAVPEIAARHHAEVIIPTLELALKEANVSRDHIEAIAVTRAPGLIPCLLVGVETAKTLSAALGIPLIGVHHMKAHIASTFVEHPHIEFPAIVLLASGGHTMLVGMQTQDDYFMIGETRDDAAGEAFDKVAKMLGLPFPGGPPLAALAEGGNPEACDFPAPMIDSTDFDFSFSGLKTAVLYYVRDYKKTHSSLNEQAKANVAASFQKRVVDVLVKKTIGAAELHDARTVIVGGGVSANKALSTRLEQELSIRMPSTTLAVPSPGLFTDNGAMIAVAAAPQALRGEFDAIEDIHVEHRVPIDE